MHYLDNIRTLINFYKVLRGIQQHEPFNVKHYGIEWKWDGSYELEINNSGFMSTIHLLEPYKSSTSNTISVLTRRLYICKNSKNFITAMGGNPSVPTHELTTEEMHFQHSLMCELPELEEIQQVYQGALELVENGIFYRGSYNGKKLNPIPVIKKMLLEIDNKKIESHWRQYYEF